MKNDYSTDPAADSAGSPAPALARHAGTPRSRVIWFVVALACSALTFRFGIWQLSRAHQKLANAALIAERGAQPPLAADALARDAAAGEAQWQRHIALKGRWDTAHTVFLMNRTMDERAGFLVTTPLRLPDGSAVIVQRGWVPRDDVDPMKVPALPMRGGDVVVAGHVAPWPSHWIDIGHGTGGPVRQNIELAPLAAESGLALRPVTIVEDASADNAHDGMRRGWAPPEVGVATNYGYAVQWFAMSIGFLGLCVWLQFIRPRQLARAASDSPLDDRVDDTAAP
jgi:surfeit locus 1 family protein